MPLPFLAHEKRKSIASKLAPTSGERMALADPIIVNRL
jgi:hypothetical protein